MAFLSTRPFKIKRTVLASFVGSTLTDSPVLLRTDDFPSEMLDADGIYSALNGGLDLYFSTDPAGINRIPAQIDEFVTDNNPANASAVVWIKLTLSAITDTEFWIHWGDPTATQPLPSDPFGSENVWNSNIQARYSMDDDPDTSSIQDSTSNANDGTKIAANEPIEVTGLYGNAQDYDSTNDKINIGTFNPANGGSSLTVSMWINWAGDDGSSYQTLIAKRDVFTTADMMFQLYRLDDAGQNVLAFFTGAGAPGPDIVTFGQDIPSVGSWVHIALVHTNGGTATLYINGSPFSASGASTWGTDLAAAIRIGHNDTAVEGFNGSIDEVKLESVAQSSDWINFRYDNENPATDVIDTNFPLLISEQALDGGLLPELTGNLQ